VGSLFEFLFKYRPVVFEHGRFALGAPTIVLLIGIAAVGVATPTLLQYARVRGSSMPRDRLTLIGLRVALLVLLLFCISRPVLVIDSVVPQQSFVGVLLDDSLSMRIRDRGGEPRSDFVDSAFGEGASPLRSAMEARFKLRYLSFAGDASRVPGAAGLEYAGQSTDLVAALRRAREELSGVPLAGLVVVSDGADNANAAMTEELLALRAGGIPVFAVGLGRERFDRDLEIGRVEAPSRVLRGTTFAADVRLTQRGLAGDTAELRVEEAGRVVHTEQFELAPDGEASVRVHITASEPGPRVFSFRVLPLDGEQVLQNNKRDVLVRVDDRAEKILYFEGEPRYELKFLRRAVETDPNLHVVTLLRTSENKFWRGGVEDSSELEDGFPKTREELFRYRGLIIGSVEASFFTGDQLRMIADFVSHRGGGLLMLGGRHAFAEGGYARTPIADALPVVLEAPGEPTRFFADVKVGLTPYGRTHGVTQLADDEVTSAQKWQDLPVLSVVNPVARAKPGAATLLDGVGDDLDSPQVVLAHQRYGRGTALAFTVQDSWQWQMHAEIPVEDRSHENFWQQLLRWLVSDVRGAVRVTTPHDRISPGRSIRLRAEVADDTYIEVNNAHVTATVKNPLGEEHELPLEWVVERDGEYTGRLDTTQAGFYEVRVDASRGEEMLGSATTWLEASPLDDEYFDAERGTALLKRIAEETGGRYYTPENAHGLAEDLSYAQGGATVSERKELWDMPVVFLLALALISTEWGYRKWRRLA
jgi:uncharacterized membrane protein